ncbi:protoporphyrinogen/coproporphyrinogen oxidase [Microbacterium sp. CFBP9034]|uniref:protoporphyrinogen/coproporphyrinogen oxidase n=1 Tax=Microbacterium sp. CFBP9034 TaxID=3096540 RepID=UPI002A6A3264|nr:FAD-dependent oxidoreductase [Microbacterium sp. CFBP9034]MDY0910925.1 FAD-dependent oxidoreductase [Microbacterium sp. CFBP9034]
MADFTVVGGGIAGLVVARRLAASGAGVVLVEASDRLGGTVARHEVAGIALDAGAESFAVRGGIVAALLAELGLDGDIVEPRPGPAWLQPAAGPAVPLPATALLGIPADPLAADVVRVVGAEAAQRAIALDALPVSPLPDDARLGALVRERFGAEVLDRLVAPVVHGVHSQHPDDVPVARAHPGLAAAYVDGGSLAGAVSRLRAAAPPGSAVAGLRGGVHRLVPALADDLARRGVDVRLGARVDDVSTLPGAVVIAAPGLASPSQPGRRIDLITLVVEQDELDAAPRGSGLLVAQGAPVAARALTHATAKWEWLREVAGGRHVLRLSYDDVPADPVETARRDAEVLLGVALPVVVDAAQVTWNRPAAASVTDRSVVGETVAGSGLAGIIAQAERAADALLGR